MKIGTILWGLALPAWCAGGFAQAPPAGQSTPAQEAGKLYTSAMSQYLAGQYKLAQPLLEKFVNVYATHECAPAAFMQLAYCQLALKDEKGYQQSLDEVIGRFGGSPAWYVAYGSKLGFAKGKKDNDQYLQLLETMLRGGDEVPFNLHGGISRQYGDYWNWEFGYNQAYEPLAAKLGGVGDPPGWIVDVIEMADTPERAERALKALGPVFQQRAKDLPPDWQQGQVALLRKAGKSPEAEKLLQACLDGWGEDPRGMLLLLQEVKAAAGRKDVKAVDDLYDRLVRTYAGYGSFEDPMYRRLESLYGQNRYEDLTALARQFMRTYSTSIYYDSAMSLWVGLAQQLAQKGDTSRIAGALAMLDEFTGKHPYRQRATLSRKLELYVLLKKYDEGAKAAGEFIGEKLWSAESYDLVCRYAPTDPAFAKLVDAAREKWKIPLPNPASKAFALLNQLKLRLKDDQTRHAEEIGEEMYGKYADDASTIEAVKLLADYYFAKVTPEPRDKWTARMIRSYPTHPLTQAVMVNQVATEQAGQRPEGVAAALDALMKNFPGTAANTTWYLTRSRCYDQADDPVGKFIFAKEFYGARAEAGELEALRELTRFEEAPLAQDYKALGQLWLDKAKGFAGTRAELYCLVQAWSYFYGYTFYQVRDLAKVDWQQAKAVAEQLLKQTHDPEIRWKLAFSEVNFAAQQGDGKGAFKAVEALLKDGAGYRDLSLRLDLPSLGSAMGKDGLLKESAALAKKLQKACPSARDGVCIELMQAAGHSAVKDLAGAGECYLRIVEASRSPARAYLFFTYAASCLRQAGSPKYAAEMDKYMRKISRVQEVVPGLMYQLAEYYVQTRDSAAFQTHKALVSRYPCSTWRDKLDEMFSKLPK